MTTNCDLARLGRYEVEALVGRGASGSIYRARDPESGRVVALKTLVLPREYNDEAPTEARSRFLRESQAAARLQHANIVTVYESGEEQGLAYIVMEFLSGHDLSVHTAPGTLLAPARVVEIGARVADALAHAHRQGVVHRDIKPANVMVDAASGAVKVTDFGIARVTDASRTRTGLLLGTPSYMAPEQMAGGMVDGRADLYSLGVMLFQLLTGRLPHESSSLATLMRQIAHDAAPDVRSVRAELSEALANVVALALQKRVALRYADGHQMAADLQAVAAMHDTAEAALHCGDASARPPKSSGFQTTARF